MSEIDALKAVAKAARRYFVGYVQDEAEERECCISEDQHEDAKALECHRYRYLTSIKSGS